MARIMATDAAIELDDFSKKRAEKQLLQQQQNEQESSRKSEYDTHDGSVAAWAWTSAALLSLASLVLLIFPRFVLFLSASESSLTSLERFLSLHLSFLLFAISVTLILYIPSDDLFESRTQRGSLGHPLLGPLTGATLLTSFISYNTKTVGSLSFIVSIMTGIVGLWGLWVILFEGTSSISKKTGADKHTSAFLFGNKTAASKQKKEWKKAQRRD